MAKQRGRRCQSGRLPGCSSHERKGQDLEDPLNRRDFLSACGKASLGTLLAGGLLGATTDWLSPQAVEAAVGNVSNHTARFWEKRAGNTVVCHLCPRGCVLAPGARGDCRARINQGGQLISLVYGKPVAVHGDPIEKAPFFHFLPGSKTLAVGTAGCGLHCKYCQNWEFTQANPETTDNKSLSPQGMVDQVKRYGIPIIIFTLNDPIQCIEYLLDTAQIARSQGIITLMHTGAYACSEPFQEMCTAVDAISIDLKGFTEDFYANITGGQLSTVLANIKTAHQTGKWLELTNLVIPGYNEDHSTFRQMCQWILSNLGPDVPLFVSRFFPKYQLRRLTAASPDTMRSLRKIGYEVGLRYVYLGNMPGDPAESTYCPACGMKVMKRNGSQITNTGLDLATGRCTKCSYVIPGVWRWSVGRS